MDRTPNRLAREQSPYLLQHQHNPVAWYPWGEEAFARAREAHRPIFLSIGYSTCHWCHVMERESFENAAIAAILNAHFVAIKVDREERPDVDKIYMTYVQAITGAGGWPLNVFVTPDLKPFYGGTYFPPASRHGRPSFAQVLTQVAQAWKTQHADILASAETTHRQLAERTSRATDGVAMPAISALQRAGLNLMQTYDPVHGGFGGTPKFPTPSLPRYLLRYAKRFGDLNADRMVLQTCTRMAAGGIYDHLGGGFARYSVDAAWQVPHFEKMLYDNAQLVELYLDAYLVSGDPQYAAVARGTLDYVLRDMTHPEGGFYSAEDADSEGREGKFYAWTEAELQALLSAAEYAVVAPYFGITAVGNFIDHSDPDPLPGQNVLRINDPMVAIGNEGLLADATRKMRQARAHRIRPHLDDKVLASWNGLMLGALARAAVVLRDGRYRAAAERNCAFLQRMLWEADTKTLYHRWRGTRDATQLLESCAFLLNGVIDLYQTTLDPARLDFAVALAESLLDRYYDTANGGFWQSTAGARDLILRVKDDYDGAEPSGNAVAVMALLRLAAITARQDFRAAAEQTLKLFADRLERLPQAVPYLLAALDFATAEPTRVVIAGDVTSSDGRALIDAAHAVYQPNKVVLGTIGAVEPFARTLSASDALATAYVCTGSSCQAPTHDAAIVLRNLL